MKTMFALFIGSLIGGAAAFDAPAAIAGEGHQSITAPPLWAALTPGPYRYVGFSRVTSGATTLHLWIPAVSDGKPMTLADYADSPERFAEPFLGAGISKAGMNSLLAERVYAQDGAPASRDSFPLVLIAHGNGQNAIDQAILSEYLASNGYVVVSVPSPMVARPMRAMEEMAEFAELQADALGEAEAIARRLAKIRHDGAALVAHSFGARAALLYSMRKPSVLAIVSLDGGIGTAVGIDELRAAPSFDAKTRLPAILHVYERLDSFMSPDFSLLTTLDVHRLTLQSTRSLHHSHFTTLGFLAAHDSAIRRVTRAGTAISDEVSEVTASVREFLDRRVRP